MKTINGLQTTILCSKMAPKYPEMFRTSAAMSHKYGNLVVYLLPNQCICPDSRQYGTVKLQLYSYLSIILTFMQCAVHVTYVHSALINVAVIVRKKIKLPNLARTPHTCDVNSVFGQIKIIPCTTTMTKWT